MPEITDKLLKEIAEYIVLVHVEDVEYESIWELTEDRLNTDTEVLDFEQMEPLVKKIDELVRSAVVTVKFPEGD